MCYTKIRAQHDKRCALEQQAAWNKQTKRLREIQNAELFNADETPFNLAGELLDCSLTPEGEARRNAQAEAEAKKAQRTFDDNPSEQLFPRKRHAHRCPICTTSVACYRKRCTKGPRITIEQCQWHRPVKH